MSNGQRCDSEVITDTSLTESRNVIGVWTRCDSEQPLNTKKKKTDQFTSTSSYSVFHNQAKRPRIADDDKDNDTRSPVYPRCWRLQSSRTRIASETAVLL
jgi:hypothetical protein